jgi:hypothetical protein
LLPGKVKLTHVSELQERGLHLIVLWDAGKGFSAGKTGKATKHCQKPGKSKKSGCKN